MEASVRYADDILMTARKTYSVVTEFDHVCKGETKVPFKVILTQYNRHLLQHGNTFVALKMYIEVSFGMAIL